MFKENKPFKSKSHIINLTAITIQLIFFGVILLYLSISLISETGFQDRIIRVVFLVIVAVIAFFLLNRHRKEPTFIEFNSNGILTRSVFRLIVKQLPYSNIKGFSLIKRPYIVNKGRTKLNYTAYLIYLYNGKKMIFTEYYFLNFIELKHALLNAGVQFLGNEDEEWNWRIKKFKFENDHSKTSEETTN